MEMYFKKINFKLIKSEVLLDLPRTRKIEGVIIDLDEENFTINIKFDYKNKFLAVWILNIEIDDFGNDIEEIRINKNNFNLNQKTDDILNLNFEDNNTIEIKLKNKNLILYEFGCIFHKEHFENDKRHLNEILDYFEKNKIWPY